MIKEKKSYKASQVLYREKDKHSELFTQTMGMIYPVIIIFGFYIIYNGHNTPGGGFQGGAILSSAFTVNYLATDDIKIKLSMLNKIEKLLYLLIVLFGVTFTIYFLSDFSHEVKRIYLAVMNMLIGLKVACGLTVIFYRFIFFESR